MHEELIPVIGKLEQAVADKNAQEIIAILDDLKGTFIYSGNEVYDRYKQIKPDLVVVLFETFEIAEFCERFIDGYRNNQIDGFDIYESLEARSVSVPFNTLWTMKDYFGYPSSVWTPKLYAVLSDEPDEKISTELIETIERLAVRESKEGTDYSEHQASMSAFRYIRWAPNDGGLSACVRLLGTRNDKVARDACKRYLFELPWGTDRGATPSLLDGLAERKTIENETLFKQALSIHQEPPILRQWIWRALFYVNPTDALLGAIDDFDRLKQSDDLVCMIDFIGYMLMNLRKTGKEFDVERIVFAAENVNTAKWSLVVRGYYGTMLRTVLPTADYRKVSGVCGRSFVSVARFGDIIQMDHMGCIVPLLLMIGTAVFFTVGLDFIMGKPNLKEGRGLAPLFWLWILWAIVNVRTHFSGQKSIVQKFVYVIIWFGLLISAIALSFAVRL